MPRSFIRQSNKSTIFKSIICIRIDRSTLGDSWEPEVVFLSATMVGCQEKFSNSRCSRMAKTIIFDLGDSILVVSALKPFLFCLCLPFFFLQRKKMGGVVGMVPLAPLVSQALYFTLQMHLSSFKLLAEWTQ